MHKRRASMLAPPFAARISLAAPSSTSHRRSFRSGPKAIRGQFRWIFALLLALGAAFGLAVAGTTTWMVNATSTNNFCATACHSMQWAAAAYEAGPHASNNVGVRATCGDCHIPFESRPATPFQYVFGTLWTKGIDGTHDVIARIRGTIEDQEKWEQERPRLSAEVHGWFKKTNSASCRGCHSLAAFRSKDPSASMIADVHANVIKAGNVDCTECHSDVGHNFAAAKP